MTIKELKQLVKIAETLGIEELKILDSGRDGGGTRVKSCFGEELQIIMWEGNPTLVVVR